jgi:hypothetical protein
MVATVSVPLIAAKCLPRATRFRFECAYLQPSAPSRFRVIAPQSFPAQTHPLSLFSCQCLLPGGTQICAQNFSDRKPANAVLQTCKTFKVIHAFRIFAWHVFRPLLPTDFRRVLSRRRSSQLGACGVWPHTPDIYFCPCTISRSATARFWLFPRD